MASNDPVLNSLARMETADKMTATEISGQAARTRADRIDATAPAEAPRETGKVDPVTSPGKNSMPIAVVVFAAFAAIGILARLKLRK